MEPDSEGRQVQGTPTGEGANRVRRPVEEPDGEGPSFEEALRGVAAGFRRLLRDRVFLAGLAITALAVLLRAYVLTQSNFIEDDYLFFAAADAGELGPDYLFDLHKGHFMPGALFLVYFQTAFWPYHWWVSAGVMLAVQAAAHLAFLRMLWELFGRRWALLVPLTVFAFAPLTVPVLGWWSAALNAVPLQLALALALLWTVRHLRTGELRAAWFAVGAVVFGMLFTVKAMFLPVLVLAVALTYLYPGGLSVSLRRAWELHRPYWATMAGLFAAYTVLYLGRMASSDSSDGAGVPEGESAWGIARGLVAEVFPVGALGGPLEWGPITPTGGLIDPRGWVVLAAWAVLGAIVLVSVWMRRRAWRAWALLLGYVVIVDVLPTIIARARFQDVVGADPRYVADAAPVFALCLALAFLPTREERARAQVGSAGDGRVDLRPYRTGVGRPARVAAVAATVVYAAAAVVSTHTYARTLQGDYLGSYLDSVRASLSDVPEEGGLYSTPVPEDIVVEWNAQYRLSSWVLSPLADAGTAERMRLPEQADTAHVFDGDGDLVHAAPGEGSAVFVPEEGEKCLETWDGIMSWPVEANGGSSQVVTVGYEAEEETDAILFLGDDFLELELPEAEEDGVWFVPSGASAEQLALHTEEDTVCVNWVSVGVMGPAEEDERWLPSGDERSDPGEDADDGGA
ncbi:hypothetical protein [Nocardiopsis kunsanensis]|uniref:hypothetical protein n=1 Tax=Nocardiopsis kunsanensis TaxID=141693 RepID=UPI000363C608|nr:hypothetical protein [Nocardiopsis kunsanensis]